MVEEPPARTEPHPETRRDKTRQRREAEYDRGRRGPGKDAGPDHAVVPAGGRHAANPRTYQNGPYRNRRARRGGRLRHAMPCMPSSATWSPRESSPSHRRDGSRSTGPPRSSRQRRFSTSTASAAGWRTPGARCSTTSAPASRPTGRLFGRPFWEDLAAHPRIAAEFDALMGPAGHGIPDFDIELSDGWESIRTVVDVGGGTGAMLASLLRRHPQAKGILVDLPGTVAGPARSSRASASPAG